MSVRLLPPNQPEDRFYRGGGQIDRFRGSDAASTVPGSPPHVSGTHQPEDWVASTTHVAGQEPIGLTVLDDGGLLRSAIEREPEKWLSPSHRATYGTDVKLLVKLLDAGQRLPVHAHPHADFAAEHLGRAHGKAEAWYILRGGSVHLGLREDVAPEELASLVASQDVDALLGLLNTVTVGTGDVVHVAPGVLHAIGEGVLILEVQEPEDLSILLEWEGFDLDGERDGHLGLGFDAVLPAVEHSALTGAALERCIHRRGSATPLLPPEADLYFRLEVVEPVDGIAIDGGFAVAVVTAGAVVIDGQRYGTGSVLLVDAADPSLTMESAPGPRAELVIARPPAPEH